MRALLVSAVLAVCAFVLVTAVPPACAASGEPASTSAMIAPFDSVKAAAAARITDPVAATRAYLESVPADRRAKTRAYSRGGWALNAVDFLWNTLLVLGVLLLTGFSARMRDAAQRITRSRALQTALYWVQFLAVTTVLGAPLAWYAGYHREKAYGLLTQSFSGWMRDQLVMLVMSAVLGGLGLIVLYAILRRASRRWWLWGWLTSLVFLVVLLVIEPVFLAPVFNKFTPLPDSPLKQSLLTMAHQHGVPAHDVFVMDASRRTQRISAYVNGIFGTMRVVIFDTTIKRCTVDEVRSVVGHEMGHYVLKHMWHLVLVQATILLLAFLFVRWTFGWATRRWPRMGISGVGDVAGLPLLLLLFAVFMTVTQPLQSADSRMVETQADSFGLDAARAPEAMATVFLKLGEYRDLDPTPLEEWLFYDHPCGRSRILHAMEWRAQHPS